MTAILAPPLVFQAFGSNGLPLSSGQLSSFIAGTSTPQATFVDSTQTTQTTQTTQNTNPIILDALGQANVWVDPTKVYKFVLDDQFGNQIDTVDQVQGSLTASAVTQAFLGAILYPQTAAELAAGVTPSNFAKSVVPLLDPLRYGGYGAGIATGDWLTAWQTSIGIAQGSVSSAVASFLTNSAQDSICPPLATISATHTQNVVGALQNGIAGSDYAVNNSPSFAVSVGALYRGTPV
jgi:hypothetical protein